MKLKKIETISSCFTSPFPEAASPMNKERLAANSLKRPQEANFKRLACDFCFTHSECQLERTADGFRQVVQAVGIQLNVRLDHWDTLSVRQLIKSSNLPPR
jgi:hypothetical protein